MNFSIYYEYLFASSSNNYPNMASVGKSVVVAVAFARFVDKFVKMNVIFA
jgi:hypothetical protein